MRKILAVLLALMLLGMTAVAEPAVLTVRGTGVVSLNPDSATITLGVRESAKEVTDAQSAVNTKLAAVVEKLKELGIGEGDIHTNSLSLYVDYDYSSSFSTEGQSVYVAENSIYFQVDDIEALGQYVDAAFEAGANTFSGITFSASDTTAEKKQALELAVESAKQKSEILAAAAGMRVTGIQAIREEGFDGYYYGSNTDALFAKAESASGAATTVYADDIQVSSTVIIDFTMEPIE